MRIKTADWRFEVEDWQQTIRRVQGDDFIYADPPYIGRHTDYYNGWTDKEAVGLFSALQSAPCGFALSTWNKNEFRVNPYFPSDLSGLTVKTCKHFYHLGSTESLRHPMEEALIIKESYAVR